MYVTLTMMVGAVVHSIIIGQARALCARHRSMVERSLLLVSLGDQRGDQRQYRLLAEACVPFKGGLNKKSYIIATLVACVRTCESVR